MPGVASASEALITDSMRMSTAVAKSRSPFATTAPTCDRPLRMTRTPASTASSAANRNAASLDSRVVLGIGSTSAVRSGGVALIRNWVVACDTQIVVPSLDERIGTERQAALRATTDHDRRRTSKPRRASRPSSRKSDAITTAMASASDGRAPSGGACDAMPSAGRHVARATALR